MFRTLAASAAAALLTFLPAAPAQAEEDSPAACPELPTSDAEGLYILSNQMPGDAYWWQKPDLTIGVQTAHNVDPAQLAAVERAVATWRATFAPCLDDQVSLTDVPTTPGRPVQADIVVHLVPHAGGNSFGGSAQCAPSRCINVLVSYSAPPGIYSSPQAPTWYTELLALHEIGHALGLGHATNLSSTDVMGYGVVPGEVAKISACDVAALRYIWSWALTDAAPARPTDLVFDC